MLYINFLCNSFINLLNVLIVHYLFLKNFLQNATHLLLAARNVSAATTTVSILVQSNILLFIFLTIHLLYMKLFIC